LSRAAPYSRPPGPLSTVRPMPSRFDTDTAVVPIGDGVYDTQIDAGWWIERGPNGGYVAAVIMQALLGEVTDPERHARSLTVHYLAPAVEGPAQVVVRTERSGRLVQYLSARLSQGDRLLATAQAAFAIGSAAGPAFADPSFPDYPHPDGLDSAEDPPGLVPMRQRYEYRHITGAPWDGPASSAETGGWIRLSEPRPYDTALVAALSDAWYPAIFTRLTERFGVPTMDLTVHLRSIRALEQMRPDDWMAVRFRTTVADEGFLEEDGQLWAPDGTLVAHSRQLALLLTA
jgi:acyl-CoA thioesterase